MAMEPPASSAAARRQPPPSPPPGFFTFLKHGFVLPVRNPALFAPLLLLTASLAAALLLGNALAVQPLAAAVLLDAAAMGRVDPSTAAYRDLATTLRSDLRRLLLSLAACLVAAVAAGSAIRVATVFAAVSSFQSSSTHRRTTAVSATVSAARANLWGPLLTVAFGHVLELACAAAIVALAVLAVVLLDYSLLLLFLDALLALLATLFLVYLAVVCAVAVAVSAAEPGRRGGAAVARAWRLVRGRGAQVAVYVAATCALGAAVSPVYTLAVRWWAQSGGAAAAGVAAGVVYVMLLGGVEVFSVVAVTAFYFECREEVEEVEEIMAGHRYVKLPGGGSGAGDEEDNV